MREFGFRLLRLIERKAAHAQGKGYGKSSIHQEAKLACQLLGYAPHLAVDIGANVGDYTHALRAQNPGAEIHLFEPTRVNVEKLGQRFQHDPLIHIVASAISDTSGPRTIFSDRPGSKITSLTKRRLDHFDINFEHTETIDCQRFEDYWRNALGRRSLDLVKMDIEGHEFAALLGFGEAIEAVRVLQFEFGGCNIDTRSFFQDFWYFFRDRRFQLFRVTPLGSQQIKNYDELDEVFLTTNFIAVHPSLRGQ